MREALSNTLSLMPARFQEERAELLQLLLREGILYRTENQPVLSRDGTSARWMLNSLAVTLTPRGAELAGRCLLELLKRFDGRQIATYGLTAVPILQSCILQSGGLYRGLLIRKERKKHGSLKLIEGQIDPHEPTILIDDSISSGTSLTEGCARLEEAGLRVEGAACLVRFGWYGGYALMQERGLHVESVFDIWEDFMSQMKDEEKPLRNPSKWFPEFAWSEHAAPEGLAPAQLARTVLLEYFTTGKLLRPPTRLDAVYDSRGGAWISIRSRTNIHLRHARDGFWHFPGEASGGTADDVVRAALRTATHLPAGERGLKIIEESGIAVTFFDALERCHVGQLDNDRYGIVVRSLERPLRMGGALPRMPGISNEWQQFQHARKNNSKLISFEPFEILRHQVFKFVEPDIVWQPTGVPATAETPWHMDARICGRIAERARDLALAHLFKRAETTAPLPSEMVPDSLDSIYVTIYLKGRLRGCMGTKVCGLDEDVRRLVALALADERFAEASELTDASANVAVSVSLLFNPLVLGQFTTEEVVRRVRHGEQALMVFRGERLGLLLPFVASTHNLDRLAYADAVIEKAGLKEPPYNWCRFDCATWLAAEGATKKLVGGFPASEPAPSSFPDTLARFARLHTDYLVRHLREDGTLFLRYEPCQNRLYQGIDLPRLAHAAWVLARAGRGLDGPAARAASSGVIGRLLRAVRETEAGIWLESEGEAPSIAELSFLLLALCEPSHADVGHELVPRIAATLWDCVDAHGRFATHRPPATSHDAYQDYFPGQACLALAHAARITGHTEAQEEKLQRAFRFYRHRFRYKRHFGQVSWLMQAFAAWWRVNGAQEFAGLVFEIGDWILEYQQEKTGAFINDHQPDTPGYTTALYLEGIGAAHSLSIAIGDAARRERYHESCVRGFSFLDRLVIQERDAAVLPNPNFAAGGLRQSIHRSEVRVDFVQHALSAILEIYPALAFD